MFEFKKDLKNSLNDKDNTINKLQSQVDKLTEQNLNLQAENVNLNTAMSSNTVNNQPMGLPKNPFLDIDVKKLSTFNAHYMNYINKLNTRASQWGETGDDSDKGFLVYLLILERARYFKNRILIKNSSMWYLEKLIYECFYYTSLSGKTGIYFEDGTPILVNVFNCEYNYLGELKGCDISYINWQNSTVWDYENIHLNSSKVKNLAICKFNAEEFGLWVLAYFYLEKVCEYFEILDTQTNFLNKKFGIENDENKNGINTQIYASLIARNSPVIVTKDLTKIKALDVPQVDLNEVFELIINFVNWFDNHLLGIRTKDIDPSDKAREIVANSGMIAAQNSKQEQNLNIFVHDFINQLNNITGMNLDWVDSNIQLTNSLINQSNTTNKISNGKED